MKIRNPRSKFLNEFLKGSLEDFSLRLYNEKFQEISWGIYRLITERKVQENLLITWKISEKKINKEISTECEEQAS